MSIPVKLEAFEGPLDLLLHLIDKNKVNIYDIPIVTITEQYMEYIKAMEEKNLELMSEFLVMAATLLRIKSQMLLPVEVKEEEEVVDPRQELVERLLEYKMYKYVSYELKDKQMDAQLLMFKPSTIPLEISDYKEEIDISELLSDLTLAKLHTIFQSVMKRQVDKIDPIRSKFGKIEKEEINLSQKILEIQQYGLEHRTFSFKKLLERQTGKMDVIVTFLGILELMKMQRIEICQNDLFEDIMIHYLANDIAPVDDFSIE
ncbi:MAG TPA: segregation/condensation protein A [Lachnoclostridium phytofermentans]|uniref:Segregation and condensation protein A n=1 Tax=Lachnoclostridium phytofermentans TaxID=66219 RepID=A0A3D2XB13_9FIRM|nr:segregation/condensation protein A [Lachnoclostridium sp.]HCL03538.1 segregation/condensation protein A [Lachnoclostridium phytofermentans]